jgi:hypothetical protein
MAHSAWRGHAGDAVVLFDACLVHHHGALDFERAHEFGWLGRRVRFCGFKYFGTKNTANGSGCAGIFSELWGCGFEVAVVAV